MKLKIKEQYLGAKITIGSITFDTLTTLEERYINYYNNGFADYFEVVTAPKGKYYGVETCPECKEYKNKCMCHE